MRFLAVLVTVALCVPLTGSGYVFQQRGEQTLSVDVDRVNVVFTVFDNKGRFITDLEQGHFKVFEDNKPQTISNFSKETNYRFPSPSSSTPVRAFATKSGLSRKPR